MTGRPTHDEQFMAIAAIVAKRSTCLSASQPHDWKPGDAVGEWKCMYCPGVRTSHAEANAVADAAARGVPLRGATAYVTYRPCLTCYKLLVMAGIARIVCGSDYPEAREETRLLRQLMGSGVKPVLELWRGGAVGS